MGFPAADMIPSPSSCMLTLFFANILLSPLRTLLLIAAIPSLAVTSLAFTEYCGEMGGQTASSGWSLGGN